MEKNQTTDSWKKSPAGTYLRNIAIFRGIRQPKGIVNGTIESVGIHYTQHYIPAFVLGEVLDVDGSVMAAGHFSAKLMRYDWNYMSGHVVKTENEPYIVYDNGVFTSIVSFEREGKSVSLETSVSSNRRITGYNYDTNSECANSFGNNSNHSVNTRDTYTLLDGIYLIHSSDYSPEFEVYKAPSTFNVADGISELVPELVINFRGSVPNTDEERLFCYKRQKK